MATVKHIESGPVLTYDLRASLFEQPPFVRNVSLVPVVHLTHFHKSATKFPDIGMS